MNNSVITDKDGVMAGTRRTSPDNVGCILGKIKPVLLMGAQSLNPSTIDH
jgi:hypothetical protein